MRRINRYVPGAKPSLHQDRDELNLAQPIASVSLGADATFFMEWALAHRSATPHHGEVMVWGGPARLTLHGIHALADADHLPTGRLRYNLTFREGRLSDRAST